MEKNITDKFLESLCDLEQKAIPEFVVFQAKMCIIDYLGCVYLGAKEMQDMNKRYLENIAIETGNTRVWGNGVRASVQAATMLNGFNSHVEELDDGHRFGMMHVGGVIISAMLGAADNFKLSPKNFIKGIVFGYECAIRLASAMQPGHKLKGYHTTATCGTIGAAFGVGVALGYTYNQLKTVLSAAATDAAGILEIQENESQIKPYNVGRAATASLNAVFMGSTFLLGPDDILGGKRGLFKIMSHEIQEAYLFGFKEKYAIEQIYRKPYAACRHCHPAIEAAIEASKKIRIDQIDTIEIQTYNLAIEGHDHVNICGASSAKLSMPYSVAVGVLFGNVGFQHYGMEYLNNADINKLMNKIHINESEELSLLVPQKRAAIVVIKTIEQECVEYRVDYPKGEPENPMSKDDIETKYFSLMNAAGVSKSKAERILDNIWNIETQYEGFLDEM